MKYTIIIKVGCPFCELALKLLKQIKESQDEIVVKREKIDFSREEFKKEFGKNATYPRVYFGKDFVGGYEELKDLVNDYVE
jgi:glutaredoxin